MTICDCPILFVWYNVGKVHYNWIGLRLYSHLVNKTVNVVISRCCLIEGDTVLFISAYCTLSILICPQSNS